MAPEVLDGAVNLRECEASLKEIDVYAMSIVLWEVGMRWSDIYGSKFGTALLSVKGKVCFRNCTISHSKEKSRYGVCCIWE